MLAYISTQENDQLGFNQCSVHHNDHNMENCIKVWLYSAGLLYKHNFLEHD